MQVIVYTINFNVTENKFIRLAHKIPTETGERYFNLSDAKDMYRTGF